MRFGNKYNNTRTPVGELNFDSKAEAARYCELVIAQQGRLVKFFVRQVGFDLPGNTKYRADYLVVWTDGRVTVEDVKGVVTQVYKLKKRQVEQLYGIEITEIKYSSADVNRLLAMGARV